VKPAHRVTRTEPMQQMPMRQGVRDDSPAVERTFGLAGLALLAISIFIIIRPFISALLWAVIITYSTSGPYHRVQDWLHGRRSLAAGLLTLFVGAIIVSPLALVSATLTESVTGLAANAQEALDQGIGPPPGWIGELPLVGPPVRDYWGKIAAGEANLAGTVKPYVSVAGGWLLSVAGARPTVRASGCGVECARRAHRQGARRI